MKVLVFLYLISLAAGLESQPTSKIASDFLESWKLEKNLQLCSTFADWTDLPVTFDMVTGGVVLILLDAYVYIRLNWTRSRFILLFSLTHRAAYKCFMSDATKNPE